LTSAGFFYSFSSGLAFSRRPLIKVPFMKKLLVVLICGFFLAPGFAWGQTWVEPYTDRDGTQVQGHWQTPEDVRKGRYSTPGKVNPYTGQFNPYTGPVLGPSSAYPTPENPPPLTPNPYYPQQDYRFQPKDYRYQGN
jgi:hypothetical protein